MSPKTGRPIKNNADYFPHENGMRNDRKLKAVRSRFGNEGYAVYNMLLEALCEAESMFLDLTEIEYEILAGDFGVDTTRLREMVDYLVLVDLVQRNGTTLFCPQLDKRIEPLFAKRKESIDELRAKNKRFRVEKSVSASESQGEGDSGSVNPPSRVEESREEESKEEKDIGEPSATDSPTPKEIASRFFEAHDNPKLRGPKYHEFADRFPNPKELQKFVDYWTEPNGKGDKVAWEIELRKRGRWSLPHRIGTWISNYEDAATRRGKPKAAAIEEGAMDSHGNTIASVSRQKDGTLNGYYTTDGAYYEWNHSKGIGVLKLRRGAK